jgi:hypothetical protein
MYLYIYVSIGMEGFDVSKMEEVGESMMEGIYLSNHLIT